MNTFYLRTIFSFLFFCSSVTIAQGDPLGDLALQNSIKNFALKLKSDGVIQKTPTHLIREIVLESKIAGEIKLYQKDPIVAGAEPLPTLFVLSGIQSSADAIYMVPNIPDMRVVVFLYPISNSSNLENVLLNAAKNLLKINTLYVAAFLWLGEQSNIDPYNIYSLNISFGSFVAPPALRLLKQFGRTPAKTIFAFGGSALDPFMRPLVENHFPIVAEQEKLISLAENLIAKISPTPHLKYLSGPFLVIRGLQDAIIPIASSESLIQNLPEPKMLVQLNSPHIDVGAQDVICQTFNVIINWIK